MSTQKINLVLLFHFSIKKDFLKSCLDKENDKLEKNTLSKENTALILWEKEVLASQDLAVNSQQQFMFAESY